MVSGIYSHLYIVIWQEIYLSINGYGPLMAPSCQMESNFLLWIEWYRVWWTTNITFFEFLSKSFSVEIQIWGNSFLGKASSGEILLFGNLLLGYSFFLGNPILVSYCLGAMEAQLIDSGVSVIEFVETTEVHVTNRHKGCARCRARSSWNLLTMKTSHSKTEVANIKHLGR